MAPYPSPFDSEHTAATQKVDCREELSVYYFCALLITALNFMPVIVRDGSSADELQVVHQKVPASLIFWLLSSFVLSVPLVIEFILDVCTAIMYPVHYQNVLEHRFGHTLLLLALVLPFILLALFRRRLWRCTAE